jgi:hypothetical protein
VTCFRVTFTFNFTFTEAKFALQDYSKNRTQLNCDIRKTFNLNGLYSNIILKCSHTDFIDNNDNEMARVGDQ